MGCNEAGMPQSVTKCGWSIKIRSIQGEDWERICVGPDITWWRPNMCVRESVWFLSIDNMFTCHHEYDLALKSSRIIVKCGLRFWKFWNNVSKLVKNVWNSK